MPKGGKGRGGGPVFYQICSWRLEFFLNWEGFVNLFSLPKSLLFVQITYKFFSTVKTRQKKILYYIGIKQF